MRSKIVQAARDVVRDQVPVAARLHRAYVGWAYSSRRAARAKLFRAIDRDQRQGAPDREIHIESTEVIRGELPKIWADLCIRRLADVPCGEFFWMSLLVDRLDYYFGGDIVPEIVERARARAPAHCEFGLFDLLTDEFPPVDAVFVRDVLPALSNRDVAKVLRNVWRSSARYFFTTTYPNKPPQDIITGDFRPLNLGAPPFSLPEPLYLLNEQSTYSEFFVDKSLGVWETAQLGARLRELPD